MNDRVNQLRDILIKLHYGASPESVQADFNHHFTGISALEIALMEQEIIQSDPDLDYTDIMKLCNVHANLLKDAVQSRELADIEMEGHPVHTFKAENLALQAALIRVTRLLEALKDNEDDQDILAGLQRQVKLLGQFKSHYDRKEYVFFPFLEKEGHHAVPQVMWGVDDQIRTLFDQFQASLATYPQTPLDMIQDQFLAFSHEFKEMVVKEEAIFLMLMMETLSQDDWLKIAEDSASYGYAIINPPAKWVPHRVDFSLKDNKVDQGESLTAQTNESSYQETLVTQAGKFTITFEPHENLPSSLDLDQVIPFGNGHLSLKEANLILNNLPLELTFVNKDDIFQYYNAGHEPQDMIFKRNPSQVGRHVELCHPPQLLDRVRKVFELLRTRQKDQVTMWFPRGDQFVHVVYKGIWDQDNQFMGVLEMVQDIQPYRDLNNGPMRDIEA